VVPDGTVHDFPQPGRHRRRHRGEIAWQGDGGRRWLFLERDWSVLESITKKGSGHMMHSLALVACTVVAFPGAGAETERPLAGTAPAVQAEGVKVEVEGAVLTYERLDIPRAKRGPRGEMEWIQKARAAVTVKKPIGFRRAVLPAGEYRLRVESEDGVSHYLVIERPAPADEEEGAGETGGEGTNGRARKARKKGGEDASFALEKKEKGESADADPPEKDAGSRAEGGKRKPESPGAGQASGPAETASMRVPLAISPCEKTGDTIAFGLKLAQKGTKLRITIRAGTTEARASLRFGSD
jgi:hypothetical protein